MNATTLLKKQHQEVRDLFDRYDAADSSSDKEAIVQELADNVAAHMTIEEQMFYPTVFEAADEAMHTRAKEEHMTVKRILADLLGMSADDEDYDDKVTMLQEQIEVHVEEEESETFKIARKELSPEALKQLGEEMKLLFDEEMANNPSDSLCEQTAATPQKSAPTQQPHR
jgi:hemerythrin-like domain-containing protein